MTQYEFEQKVKLIISEQVGVDFVEITNSDHIEDDLLADSLDKVELVMALEEEFDVEISDELAEKSLTVDRILINLAYLKGYTFYAADKPSDNSNTSLVSNPTPVKEIPLGVHTESSGSIKPLPENEVFDAMMGLSKKTKMLVDFSPCGKVSIEPEEYKDFDERFIVDNYDDFAKVIESLETLNKFRG